MNTAIDATDAGERVSCPNVVAEPVPLNVSIMNGTDET
jgi:hypothetical protein